MTTDCVCTRCNPIIAVKRLQLIKQHLEAATYLHAEIIRCERISTAEAMQHKLDNIHLAITQLEKQLEHTFNN